MKNEVMQDTYVSHRPDRQAYAKEAALKIIEEGKGTKFDASLVDVFVKMLKQEE